jgi:hypothetical protein
VVKKRILGLPDRTSEQLIAKSRAIALALQLHPSGQRTLTSKLSNMLGTLKGTLVAKRPLTVSDRIVNTQITNFADPGRDRRYWELDRTDLHHVLGAGSVPPNPRLLLSR